MLDMPDYGNLTCIRFEYKFTVHASLDNVLDFHRNTRTLKWLTPPPVFVQLHHVQPLAEGSISEFTLWFGPLPVRWKAIHTSVGPHGFTDTQQSGPMKVWRHTHRFLAEGEHKTQIHERIEYQHHSGLRGILSRLLFTRPTLWMLFTYRRLITRWQLERQQEEHQTHTQLPGGHHCKGTSHEIPQ